tara:strand:- start:33 stop:209 length:177 start_codon:yes stop_codon:yes gene_type:complete
MKKAIRLIEKEIIYMEGLTSLLEFKDIKDPFDREKTYMYYTETINGLKKAKRLLENSI